MDEARPLRNVLSAVGVEILMRRIVVSLTCLPFALGALRAQESVPALVAKLGSTTFLERETAAKKLEAIGASALPALRASMASADLETKRRSLLIMERIEDRLMRERLLRATPVHFQFKETPFRDATRIVGNHMRVRLPPFDDLGAVTLETGEVPYWRGWRKFCDAAGIEEADFPSISKFKFLTPDDVQLFTDKLRPNTPAFRPFVVSPQPLIIYAVQPAKLSEDDRHSVRVRLRWQGVEEIAHEKRRAAVFAVDLRMEPHLQLCSLTQIEINKIIDETGENLPAEKWKLPTDSLSPQVALLVRQHAGELQWNGQVQLIPIAWEGPVRPLREIHGIVKMQFVARPPMIEIADVFGAIWRQERGPEGVTMRILSADRKAMRLRVQFSDIGILTPMTDAEKIVRIRPGLVGVRGPMDIALDCLELHSGNGRVLNLMESSYAADKDGKGYVANVTFEMPTSESERLTLVLVKKSRPLDVEMPFLVRNIAAPTLHQK